MKMKLHAKEKVKKSTIEKFKKKYKKNNKIAINKKRRIKVEKPEVAPTTIEELNELHTKGTVCNSNLFRLQIETVLREWNMKSRRVVNMRSNDNENGEFRDQLESFLNNDPSLMNFEMQYKHAFEKYVQKAMPQLDQNLFELPNVALKFERSSEVLFVNLEDVPGRNLKQLILLEMPVTLFREKDYLNQKYLHRKAFFLAVYYWKLVEFYARNEQQIEIGIDFHKNNPYLPFVRLQNRNMEFEIFAVLNCKQFPRSRLAFTTSNIRSSHVFESVNEVYATPFYNSVLSHDLNKMSLWLRIREMLTKTPRNVINGFQLILLWFQQRTLTIGFGSFDHELLLLLLHRLLNNDNIINFSMNCETIFRKVLNWFLNCESSDAAFSSAATGVQEQLLVIVRQLVNETISLMDSGRADACSQIFVQKYDFYEYFDALLSLKFDDAVVVDLLSRKIAVSSFVDYVHFLRPLFSQYLLDQLNFALNDRVQIIVPFDFRKNCLMFGIRLKDDVNIKASGSLTIGPEVKSNDQQSELQCKEFRDFWGHLSEMRRFRDSRVHECVHWNAKTIHQKRTVLTQIVDYLLNDKLKIDSTHYRLIANETESVNGAGIRMIQDELSIRVINAFDALCVLLKSLGTALDITAIEMLSPIFSNTELFPEIAFFQQSAPVESRKIDCSSDLLKHVPPYVGAINAVLQFSRHSQWPDSYEAIENLKISLLNNIKELLKKEQNIDSRRNKDYLDVHFHGYIFRFRVFQVKSLLALKKVEENGASQLELDLNIMAKIRAALKGIQSRNSSFGPSTALIIRWFRSQLLDQELIRFEFLEILNAYLYLRNIDAKKHLPQIAFLEFIKFYAKEFDWKETPYFVNFNGLFDESPGQMQQIETAFAQDRHQFPPVFVCTPFETQLQNKLFASQLSPSPEILKWSKLIAKQSFQIIQNQIYDLNFEEAIRNIFTPNLVGYDLLLKMKKKFIARKLKSDSEIEQRDNDKNTQRLVRPMPIIEYNPVERYLHELRRHYGDIALFFYDSYDGDTIGVLWKPTTTAHTLLGHERCQWEGREPDNDKMKFNYDTFIYEFVQRSGALIETVNQRK